MAEITAAAVRRAFIDGDLASEHAHVTASWAHGAGTTPDFDVTIPMATSRYLGFSRSDLTNDQAVSLVARRLKQALGQPVYVTDYWWRRTRFHLRIEVREVEQ